MLLKKLTTRGMIAVCLMGCMLPSLAAAGDSNLGPVAPGDNTDPFRCKLSQNGASDVSQCNRSEIAKIANSHLHAGTYSGARERMFQFVDVYTNQNGVRVVKSVYTPDEYPVGTQGIPQNGVNCEHTYPQSFLKTSSRYPEARADIFHLFPVNGRENTSRSNLPYADCGSHSTERGKRCAAGYEPPEQHKGVVARAMFYVATTYALRIDDTQEEVLRRWNRDYPVTNEEMERSVRVTEVQGNQNPFVTNPEWVDLIIDY